jgi:hypothetical protein
MDPRACLLIFVVLAGAFASSQVREKETSSTREQEVRDLIEKFNLDYQQKDPQAISGIVSPDLRAFVGGRVFASWGEFRDGFLTAAFSRRLPASTWEIEKIATAPEMAWAYTKTTYTARLEGQPVEADLYQLFVLQKLPAQSNAVAKSSSSINAQTNWKIVVIDNSFHREGLGQQMRPDAPQAGAQPK